jgi:hypothetical protein
VREHVFIVACCGRKNSCGEFGILCGSGVLDLIRAEFLGNLRWTWFAMLLGAVALWIVFVDRIW